jgi:hypothetical protein
MLVPLREKKTQRSITLPDRLWEFIRENENNEVSYTEGVRIILEEAYQKANTGMKNHETIPYSQSPSH